jgi:hypothetical protein
MGAAVVCAVVCAAGLLVLLLLLLPGDAVVMAGVPDADACIVLKEYISTLPPSVLLVPLS